MMMTPESLQHIIKRMEEKSLRIVTAESLTCGLISSMLVNVSGASAVVNGGFSVYQDEMKSALLGVPPDMLKQFTAVSPQVAEAMALGALKKTDQSVLGDKASHIAIAVTGYASDPGDLAPASDTGLVYIAIASQFNRSCAPDVQVHEHRFTGNRTDVRQQTVAQSCTYLLDLIQ